ncbi:MAG: hypothetical protein LUM44_05480 [Pyrinomonadaceae bacterium]|nr:hypothetical protein [Pyrinomonadaceae bacterium]
MKKTFFLAAFICLLAISAFAQNKATDFSGTWELDVAKSKLDERMRVESMSMTVTQTGKDLTVATQIKRAPRPEGGMGGGRPEGAPPVGGGMGGRRGMMGGDMTTTYSLDGKETTAPSPGGQTGGVATLKAEMKGTNLKLMSTRSFEGPMGEVNIKNEENWTLSADGKILTVKREQSTPRGNMSSELVFVKK